MLPSPAQPRPAPSTTATARACTERPLGARAEGSMGRRPTFLWKTGLVWPPKPACFLSYRRLPVRARRGVGAAHSAQRAPRGKGRAWHGTALVWSCVPHELRPRRLTAAAAGPSSSPTGWAAATVPHRCTGCAVPGPRRLERLGGSKEGEWMEGGAAATRPSHPSRRHRGSSPPPLHQRLAHTAAASPLQLARLAGKHSSTGSRG